MKTLSKRIGDRSGYLFIAPAVIFMGIFIVYPMVSSVSLSMTNWYGLKERTFIGLENYGHLIRDPVFWQSLKLQFIWAVMSVVLLAIGGLILAILVEFFVPIKQLIPVARTIMFMPMMMSMVSLGLLWSMLLNPMIGIINELFRFAGILSGVQTLDLLGNKGSALYAAFLPCIWQWSGFGMVVFSAAMQGIPSDIMESSIMDGCSKFKQIRYIVLPLLKPTIATVCTLNLIGGFKCFDLIYAMTAGGPANATQVTSIYIFKEAFTNTNFGYASAMSFVLFLVTAIFGAAFFTFSKRFENYV